MNNPINKADHIALAAEVVAVYTVIFSNPVVGLAVAFGRTTAVKVGNTTLSQYTYNNKCLPATLNYGNGVVVRYGYNNLNWWKSF